MNLTNLQEICATKGLQLSENQLKQFQQYADFLVEYNDKVNLTAILEFEEIVEKHFYDSLLPSFMYEMKGKIVDIGAGAGFPSIVLKIAYPDLKVTIVETLKKRCVFLEELVTLLNIDNVIIINGRAEEVVKEMRETFDYATARAVANLRMLSELCIPFVKVGGYFIAMKGKSGEEEAIEAEKALATLKVKKDKEEIYSLSDGAKRVNIGYLKIAKCPMKYPRQFAKIKKSPL